jgi:hypothetical protein
VTIELSGRQLTKLVEQQLGRPPSIGFYVAVTCSYGWPAVISSEPFTVDGAPNPNIYYLTCPFLRHAIAVLEDGGMIGKLEEAVAEDSALREQLVEAHKQHVRTWVHAAGRTWPGGSPDSPKIAAAASELSIKCLHAHAAWFLVNNDRGIGMRVIETIGERWCGDETCADFDIGMEGSG